MKTFFYLLYALRCACSATAAYLLAEWLRLPFPVWAAMSAVIVSQTELHETRASLLWRILGTLIGIVVSLAVDAIVGHGTHMGWQILIAVGICAIIASWFPVLRVCMWTAPIILLTAGADVEIYAAGFYRGSEVILGCLVGGGLHLLINWGVRMLGIEIRKEYLPQATHKHISD